MQPDRLTRFICGGSQAAGAFTAEDWGALIREARRSNLLSRVAYLLVEDNALHLSPDKMRWQFESAQRVARSSARSVRCEVAHVYKALHGAGIPFVLLKGAAYEMAGLPASAGRLFVDVDIMVPKSQLHETEVALVRHGWLSSNLDAYDQKYYRTWMHEIPPMQNIKRKTSLDVHHTILPPTAALKPDVALLWEDAVELPQWPGMYVLSEPDMILHSATHLFHDGELEGSLRDLVDLDALLRHFSQDGLFWSIILDRARELDLSRPLYYALKHTSQNLETPVPDAVQARAEIFGAPSLVLAPLMNLLIQRTLNPSRKNLDSIFTRVAKWLLYVRSHFLRMPLYLLIPHLTRKALKSE